MIHYRQAYDAERMTQKIKGDFAQAGAVIRAVGDGGAYDPQTRWKNGRSGESTPIYTPKQTSRGDSDPTKKTGSEKRHCPNGHLSEWQMANSETGLE